MSVVRAASLTLAGAVAALALGCPREEAPAPEDRALRLLAEEKARLAARGEGTARGSGQGPSLADAVAQPRAPRELTLPGAAPVRWGTVSVKARGAVTQQSVASSKMTLTTADTFLKVTLEADPGERAQVDLAGVEVVNGKERWPLARDVQRLGGGSPLTFTLTPGPSQPVVLYFELPLEAIGPGLRLALPAEGGAVEVPLQ